jgi:phosphomannomutase
MTLIKSISGIRGTIGGKTGDTLSPADIVRFTAAYGAWIIKRGISPVTTIVVGRDARTTGSMVSGIVVSTLQSLGINVIDIGLATTPTVEVAVTGTGSSGGIIITASHNPANWNALKLLNEKGEFLNSGEGNEVLDIAGKEDYLFATHDKIGKVVKDTTWGEKHLHLIIDHSLVNTDAIRKAGFKIAVDCINSVGGLIVPDLLNKLGVKQFILLNGIPDGNFAHNPEPLPGNLKDISEMVVREKADLGFVVDPDVDRLAVVCEDGSMFGEEYTLVSVADHILARSPGNTVSNMSSSRALKDVTEIHGGEYFTSAVGEINVVEEMKRRKAVIGGEGNGGVIFPEMHYGRDALAGIALFLSLLAERNMKCSELRKSYPDYFMAKTKLAFDPGTDIETILEKVKDHYRNEKIDERDGLRIDTETGWVQIRRSNTEPIIRIYSEARTMAEAETMAEMVMEIVKKN